MKRIGEKYAGTDVEIKLNFSPGSLYDFVLCGAQAAVCNVVVDGVIEKNTVLHHNMHKLSKVHTCHET